MILNWSMRHPRWNSCSKDWKKWQAAYNGGREFIDLYLKNYSAREDHPSFLKRKELTYCPRFAGAAIDDVKNSIYQRMPDIVRVGGSKTYQDAVKFGVDHDSHSMNYFIGQFILPELLIKAKVGVYIDAPFEVGSTLAESHHQRPYLTWFCAEDILNWNHDCSSLLVREHVNDCDIHTGLTKSKQVLQYRFYKVVEDGVEVYIVKNPQNPGKNEYPDIKASFFLPGMKRIPFVQFELSKSLMEDIADYQIALLNLQSSDLNYLLQANFPFYVEQADLMMENVFAKAGADVDADGNTTTGEDRVKEISLGPTNGRRYPKGLDRPEFIHPSPEPLLASIQKEEQIKTEIRHLLNLTLSTVEPKFASAESKGMDQRSLEAGLAAIGIILENGEREIAEIWSYYDKDGEPATVNYPKDYSLKSDGERRLEAKADQELMVSVPSRLYQKMVAKRIAHTMVGHIVTVEDMDKIYAEIDVAKYISADPEAITSDLENALVSNKTASAARGYAPGESEAAEADHAKRIERIQAAQTAAKPPGDGLDNPAARGVKDLATDPKAAKTEKAANATTS